MQSKFKKLDFTKKQIEKLIKKIELIDKDISELKDIKSKRELTPLELSFLHSLNDTRKQEVKELREIIQRSEKK